jgi:hypothetical protein
MPIFYRGRDIRITDCSLELPARLRIRTPERGRVLVVTPPARRCVTVRTYCSASAIGLFTVLVGWPEGNHVLGWVLLALVVGAVVERTRRRWVAPPRQELWMDVGGRLVRLYSSDDPIEFGQVRRALQRAIEWNEDARP